MSTDDVDAEMLDMARTDIAQAEDFISTIVQGVTEFSVLAGTASREELVATFAVMIDNYADDEGVLIIAAVAMMMLVEKTRAEGRS